MGIEHRFNSVSLQQIVEYFGKKNFDIDYDKYKFVLTNEEIYIFKQFISSCTGGKEFNCENISNTLRYDLGLIKKNIDRTMIARLIVTTYKKIRYVDSHFINEEEINNKTLMDLLYKDSEGNSITLNKYIEYSNNGVLNASTCRLERFILKYRIGMLNDYKKITLKNQLDLEFYEDVANFCYRLGYTDTIISKNKIDNILYHLNRYFILIEELLHSYKDVDDIDLAITFINDRLKQINMDFKKQNDMSYFDDVIVEIKEKLNDIKTISRPYINNNKTDEDSRKL